MILSHLRGSTVMLSGKRERALQIEREQSSLKADERYYKKFQGKWKYRLEQHGGLDTAWDGPICIL